MEVVLETSAEIKKIDDVLVDQINEKEVFCNDVSVQLNDKVLMLLYQNFICYIINLYNIE